MKKYSSRLDMRILTVSHTAGSSKHGMLFRPFYLSREFVKLGHEASIVSASYFHTRYLNPSVQRNLEEETLDGVRFVWLKTFRYGRSELVRALGMLWFSAKVFAYARRLASRLKPHVVIATSPDPLVIFGAWRIARLSRAKLVFEFRDIWPLTLIELSGKSKWHPFICLLRAAERFALSKADLVVSVLGRAEVYLREIGCCPRRFAVIPNGVAMSEFVHTDVKEDSPLRATLEELRARGKFLLGYLGHHGVATALFPLIHAMAQLKDESVALVLVGDGSDKQALEAKARDLGLRTVLFFDPIPKPQVAEVLRLFDACYVGSQPTGLYRYGLSFNKIFDYMMAARPIVSAINSESDPIVIAGCGIKARGQEPGDIADAIRRMVRLPASEHRALGEKGRAFVVREHDYTALATKYLGHLQALTACVQASDIATTTLR